MSLLFNRLFRYILAFLPKSKYLLISWLQSPSAVILEPKKRKPVTVSIVSASICHEMMGLDAMILVFWMLSFKPDFSLYCFTFIKRLFSSSLFSATKVVSSAYLRLSGYWYFSWQSWFQLMLHPAYIIPNWHTPLPLQLPCNHYSTFISLPSNTFFFLFLFTLTLSPPFLFQICSCLFFFIVDIKGFVAFQARYIKTLFL